MATSEHGYIYIWLGKEHEKLILNHHFFLCLNEELPEGGNLNDYIHEFSSLLEFPALQLPYSKFKKVGISKYFTFLYPIIYNPALLDYNIIKPARLLFRMDKPTLYFMSFSLIKNI